MYCTALKGLDGSHVAPCHPGRLLERQVGYDPEGKYFTLVVGQLVEKLLYIAVPEAVHGFFLDVTAFPVLFGAICDLGTAIGGSSGVDESAVGDDEDPGPERVLVAIELPDVPRYMEEGLSGKVVRVPGTPAEEITGYGPYELGVEMMPRPFLATACRVELLPEAGVRCESRVDQAVLFPSYRQLRRPAGVHNKRILR